MSRVPCLGCQSDAQPVACGVATVNAFMSAILLFAIDPNQVRLYLAGFCEAHAAIAARVLCVMADRNHIAPAVLQSKLSATFLVPDEPFTCPRCGAVSHNPNDRAEGYCGRCHDWTGPNGYPFGRGAGA